MNYLILFSSKYFSSHFGDWLNKESSSYLNVMIYKVCETKYCSRQPAVNHFLYFIPPYCGPPPQYFLVVRFSCKLPTAVAMQALQEGNSDELQGQAIYILIYFNTYSRSTQGETPVGNTGGGVTSPVEHTKGKQ